MGSPQRKTPGAAGTASEGRFKSTQHSHNNLSPAQTLLSRLDAVRGTGRDQWLARCPGHDDGSPSLSVRELGDGRVLLHCFAGCEPGEVLGALNMRMGDLFPDNGRNHARPAPAGQRWNYRDLIRALHHEAVVVIICANDMVHSGHLPEADRERVTQAAIRIARVLEVAA